MLLIAFIANVHELMKLINQPLKHNANFIDGFPSTHLIFLVY